MTVQLEKEELMEENFYPEKQIDEKKYSCQILLEKPRYNKQTINHSQLMQG